MKENDPDSDLFDQTLVAAITADLTSPALSSEQRDRLRAKVLRQARDAAPPGTFTVRREQGHWKRLNNTIEFKQLRVDAEAGTQTILLRVEPGGELAGHFHQHDEELFVLEGECLIGNHKLSQGDAHFVSAGEYHDAITSPAGVTLLVRTDYCQRAGSSDSQGQ